ncbi:MAG: DUF1622 domain-containing protein [Eubacteriales bacterium]|nr:DUF1622 domain-containing protein [Eubacteriales bacterium]
MEEVIILLIKYVARFIEICGIFVILSTVVREMYKIVFRYRFKIANTERDTSLNQGLASALEILLGAEILNTIVYRNIRQLAEVAALIIIRIFMTVLIHWELEHKLKLKQRENLDNEAEKS